MFAKLYKVLRLERLGFGRPRNFVSSLLTNKAGLTREPEIHVLGPSLAGSAGGHRSSNGYAGHDGRNGYHMGYGKRKQLRDLTKWLELHQDSLNLSGRSISQYTPDT